MYKTHTQYPGNGLTRLFFNWKVASLKLVNLATIAALSR